MLIRTRFLSVLFLFSLSLAGDLLGADISAKLMAPAETLEGLDWGLDDAGEYHTAAYKTGDHEVRVEIPNGKALTVESNYTHCGHWYGWISTVSVRQQGSLPEMETAMQSVLDTFDATLPEEAKKKWEALATETTGKPRFEADVKVSPMAEVQFSVRKKKDGAWDRKFTFALSPEAEEISPLPEGTWEWQYRRGGNTARRPLEFSPDSRVLAMGFQLVDPATGKVVGEIASEEVPYDLAFSPDGRRMAVTSNYDEKLLIIDVSNQSIVHEASLTEPDNDNDLPFQIAGFSPDGKSVFLARQKIKEWSMAENKIVRTFGSWEKRLAHAALSPDGQWIAVAQRHETGVTLWNVSEGTGHVQLKATGKAAGMRPVHADRVEFSSDSQQVLASGFMGNAFSLYDVKTKEHTPIPTRHSRRAAWAPGGKYLAFGTWTSPDPNALIVLDVPSGKLAGIVRPLGDIWLRTRWSPDGKWIAVVSNYGRVLCFDAKEVLGRE